jgi:hypothetical protein
VALVDEGSSRAASVAQQRDQAELRDYAAKQDTQPATSLGSLADKLRGALKGR